MISDSNDNENKLQIIPGFASFKYCFETFRHIDGSTRSLSEARQNSGKAKRGEVDFSNMSPKRGEATKCCFVSGSDKDLVFMCYRVRYPNSAGEKYTFCILFITLVMHIIEK